MLLSDAAFNLAYEERVQLPRSWTRRRMPLYAPLARARKFKSLFGLDVDQATKLWNALEKFNDMSGWKPVDVLDALYFLKVYPTEHVQSAFAKKDEKTLRKWNWKIVEAIADLPCIHWERRLVRDNGSISKITVDGTDFRIYEPTPFSSRWFSHKFKGPGLRYEVGICIQTGEIVWLNGPYPCGDYPDLRIAREGLIYALAASPEREMAVADGGYNDGYEFFDTPTGVNNEDQYMKALARARHETINKRFKDWGALSKRWRHSRNLHGKVFYGIANLTHLSMSTEGPTTEDFGSFQVQYFDN